MKDQRSKNIILLIILGFLVLSSVVLVLTSGPSKSTIENRGLFTVQDTSRIDQISITSKQGTISLDRKSGTWLLNEKYKAEQNIIKVLLAILKDNEVLRNVPRSQEDEIAEYIKNQGYLVELYNQGKLITTFFVSGNSNKTVSYMMRVNDDSPMIIGIPGYESYVAGIFEITTNDWRDRLILSTNWRTLKQLTINYTQYPEYNLNIEFKDNFLGVEGVSTLDTARMMSFIEQFSYLQVDKYLDSGQNDRYDSLLNTPETVSISINDINPSNTKTINFYPLIAGDPMMLGFITEDDQMVLFEGDRIQKVFAIRSEFEANSNE